MTFRLGPAPSWLHPALLHLFLGLIVSGGLLTSCNEETPRPAPASGGASSQAPASRKERDPVEMENARIREIHATYAGSESCRPCHEAAYEEWKNSHHALAERPFREELDGPAFEPPRQIQHGTQTSSVALVEGKPRLTTPVADGVQTFEAELVFGVSPLRQLLIPAPGGRLQATELAFDARDHTWFDVYGDEDRQPGEWGHWTGRGMNWNSMCASCHNTRLFKNYDPRSDTYQTLRAEMGVGCEACHGPARAHVEWQEKHGKDGGKDPTIHLLEREKAFQACGPCHARRGELTGDFVPGHLFLDHYLPVIPDESDIYYPDGQVRDENYEFVSFLSSEMHTQGVRCFDCHFPHSGKTRFEGNDLCLQCHREKVDPATHGNHVLGQPGSFCTDCHMPLTTYMQRHPRRDHGFTIPDPALTIDFGIPNACNRCHDDQTAEWALEWTKKWYGDKPPRHTQARARTIALARQGETSALKPLQELARTEKSPLWRAVATGLLRRWIDQPGVEPVVLERLKDSDALVRSVAVRNLELLLHPSRPDLVELTQAALDDPVRAVRIGAAWSLRQQIDPLSQAGQDLHLHLRQSLDQPGGSMQMGILTLDQGYVKPSLPYFERAIHWDAYSSPLRYNYAIALSMAGRTAEAATQLEAAVRLEPDSAPFHFSLALAYAELNRHLDAERELLKAIELEPGHARAWYNLGQIRFQRGDAPGALEATRRGGALVPDSAEFPYAEAYIHHQTGQMEEALEAAHRALDIDPGYGPARQLADVIEGLLEEAGS